MTWTTKIKRTAWVLSIDFVTLVPRRAITISYYIFIYSFIIIHILLFRAFYWDKRNNDAWSWSDNFKRNNFYKQLKIIRLLIGKLLWTIISIFGKDRNCPYKSPSEYWASRETANSKIITTANSKIIMTANSKIIIF